MAYVENHFFGFITKRLTKVDYEITRDLIAVSMNSRIERGAKQISFSLESSFENNWYQIISEGDYFEFFRCPDFLIRPYFRGIIIRKQPEQKGKIITLSCSAVDESKYFQGIIINEVFENKTVKEILEFIISKYLSNINCVAGNIEEGIKITKKTFVRSSFLDVLNFLVESNVNYCWDVSYEGRFKDDVPFQLNFYKIPDNETNKIYSTGPVNPNITKDSFDVEFDYQNFFNRLIFIGGTLPSGQIISQSFDFIEGMADEYKFQVGMDFVFDNNTKVFVSAYGVEPIQVSIGKEGEENVQCWISDEGNYFFFPISYQTILGEVIFLEEDYGIFTDGNSIDKRLFKPQFLKIKTLTDFEVETNIQLKVINEYGDEDIFEASIPAETPSETIIEVNPYERIVDVIELINVTGGGGKWDLLVMKEAPGNFIDSAYDSQSNIHACYWDSSSQILKYLFYDGETVKTETVDDTIGAGTFCRIAVDSNNVPHICYKSGNTLKYAYYSMSNEQWYNYNVDVVNVAGYCSIALNSNDRPFISYRGENKLKCAKNLTGSWIIETVDTNDSGMWTDIVINKDNNYVYISYGCETTKNLKYAIYDGSSWSYSIVDGTNEVGYYTSIDLDANGYPYISYYNYGTNDLKLAYNWGTWTAINVDTVGNVGMYTSIKIDSKNYPVISYYDATNSALKIARRIPSGWKISTIDTEGDVGKFSSILLDSQDIARILYLDETNGTIKSAKWQPEKFQFIFEKQQLQTNTKITIFFAVPLKLRTMWEDVELQQLMAIGGKPLILEKYVINESVTNIETANDLIMKMLDEMQQNKIKISFEFEKMNNQPLEEGDLIKIGEKARIINPSLDIDVMSRLVSIDERWDRPFWYTATMNFESNLVSDRNRIINIEKRLKALETKEETDSSIVDYPFFQKEEVGIEEQIIITFT